MSGTIKELLKSGSDKLGVPLSSEQALLFVAFYEELKRWGSRMNLTALLNEKKRLVEELFLDPLNLLKVMPAEKNRSLLDIGSGAGIPGIPVKIAAPPFFVTLTDSRAKKVYFMRHVIRKLGLYDIEAKNVRFDDSTFAIEKRTYDWAVSKAVADKERTGLWARPFLNNGGRLICMKGPAEKATPLEGYEGPEEYAYSLPFSGMSRQLYIYRII